jgi:hypothetical protein
MVTLLAGEGGAGKSTLLLDLVARVTTRRGMPDGTSSPDERTGVIVLSSEDDWASVIVPRLIRAGADLSCVAAFHIGTGEEGRPPVITPADLAKLESAILELNVRLVILDPLAAYVDERTNLHHNQDARRVMARLHVLAERHRVAVAGIHHFNRGRHQDSAHRLTGSLALSQAARSVLVVGADPGDSSGERKILALAKHNLAPRSTASMAYHLSVSGEGEHPRIEWLGASQVNAQDLAALPVDPEDRSALDAAMEFLTERLADGPVPAPDLFSAADQEGIAARTLRRAQKALGVVSRKSGGPGTPWVWALPPIKGDPSPDVGRLRLSESPKPLELADKVKGGQLNKAGRLNASGGTHA